MNNVPARRSARHAVEGSSIQGRQLLSKVPEVTIFFWIIKVLCTTVGETFADFLNINLGFGLTVTSIIMGVAFAVVLFIQFRAKKYIPGIYWVTVVLISVFGTLVTDNMVENMNVRLTTSVIMFTVLLASTFAIWFLSEKTLSIHSIFTAKREAFYWLAILFTFALGTATGDYVAEELSLGYTLTGLIVLAIIACTFIAWKVFKFDAILTFWITYVLTRPLGASLGDFMSQPASLGGLGLGATVTSVIFLSAILIVVLFLSITKMDRILKEKGAAAENRATPRHLAKQAGAVYSVTPGNTLSAAPKNFAIQAGVMAGVFVVAGIFIGVYAHSHNKMIADKKDLSGELAGFIATETDMRGYVVANDFKDARAKADTLEQDWDSSEGTLRPQNQGEWTQIDVTFDQVLTAVRTTTDVTKCTSVIDNSLSVLDRINAGAPDGNPSASDTASPAASANSQTVAPAATSPAKNQTGSPAASSPSENNQTASPAASSLGDLSSFLQIEQDMLALVNKGDLAGAKTRANDLETAWDNAQATLQPKDPTKWTQIDGTLDDVFSAVRAKKPNQATCKSALETAINALQ